MNTSQPASARFAQSYVFTANDAFVFIASVGGQRSPTAVLVLARQGDETGRRQLAQNAMDPGGG